MRASDEDEDRERAHDELYGAPRPGSHRARPIYRDHEVVTRTTETVTPPAGPPRMRIPTILAALAALTTIATASTAHRIEQIDRDHATMSLVLTTRSRSPTEVVVPVEVPEGMAITGLTLRIGREAPLVGRPLGARFARTIYDDVVREIRDPALLEATERGIRLSVFPITRSTPARITIELTAVDQLAGLARVEPNQSFVAVPGEIDETDPYASYWPAHHPLVPEVVAVNERE